MFVGCTCVWEVLLSEYLPCLLQSAVFTHTCSSDNRVTSSGIRTAPDMSKSALCATSRAVRPTVVCQSEDQMHICQETTCTLSPNVHTDIIIFRLIHYCITHFHLQLSITQNINGIPWRNPQFRLVFHLFIQKWFHKETDMITIWIYIFLHYFLVI